MALSVVSHCGVLVRKFCAMSDGIGCLVSLVKGVKEALLNAELAGDYARELAEQTDQIQTSLETIHCVLLPQVHLPHRLVHV